jgi:hypothetical protein
MVNYGDLVSRKEELRIREFGDFLTSVQMACVQTEVQCHVRGEHNNCR